VILSVLLLALLAVPLVLILGQGLVVLSRALGMSSPAELDTRAEFARIGFAAPGAAPVTMIDVVPADEAAPAPVARNSAPPLAWRACPTCGGAITTRARLCRHCGSQLSPGS
jgi:hypothetical protein